MKESGSKKDGKDVTIFSKKRQGLIIKWIWGAKAGRRDK